MARSWTWLDSKDLETMSQSEIDIQSAKIAVVVNKLNRINDRNEELRFLRMADEDWDNGYDPDMTDEEHQVDQARRSFVSELEDREIKSLYNLLEELGARLMRPYEHWNEDEQYMAYMERDRD